MAKDVQNPSPNLSLTLPLVDTLHIKSHCIIQNSLVWKEHLYL